VPAVINPGFADELATELDADTPTTAAAMAAASAVLRIARFLLLFVNMNEYPFGW
jgi:hypothetical protein